MRRSPLSGATTAPTPRAAACSMRFLSHESTQCIAVHLYPTREGSVRRKLQLNLQPPAFHVILGRALARVMWLGP